MMRYTARGLKRNRVVKIGRLSGGKNFIEADSLEGCDRENYSSKV